MSCWIISPKSGAWNIHWFQTFPSSGVVHKRKAYSFQVDRVSWKMANPRECYFIYQFKERQEGCIYILTLAYKIMSRWEIEWQAQEGKPSCFFSDRSRKLAEILNIHRGKSPNPTHTPGTQGTSQSVGSLENDGHCLTSPSRFVFLTTECPVVMWEILPTPKKVLNASTFLQPLRGEIHSPSLLFDWSKADLFHGCCIRSYHRLQVLLNASSPDSLKSTNWEMWPFSENSHNWLKKTSN